MKIEKQNEFLRHQEDVLEQGRQLAAEREAQRQAGTENQVGWHPDVIKSAENGAKPGVFNANEERRPLPPRLQKPALLSIADLRERATEVGNSIDAAVEQFKHDDAHRDNFYADLKTAEETVARLERELAEAKAEAEQLRSRGTPKEQFLNNICKGELAVLGVAGAIIDRLLEDASQASFHCSYEKLSPSTRNDLFVQFADRLQIYRSGFYTRLGKRAALKQSLTAEQVQARADDLLKDLTDLLDKELA
jgi:chromosome segregation ATPase